MLQKLLARLARFGRAPAPSGAAAVAARDAADRLIGAGNRAENSGSLREACEQYRLAVEAAPGYAKAHLNLGIGLEALGDAEGAIKSHEAALAIDPGNAYANYNLANLLCARGDLERSGQLLRLALESKPDFPQAHVALSNVYDLQGNLAGAATALEVALKQQPDNAGAWYNYGMIQRNLGKLAEAKSALQRAILVDPDHIDALYFLGNVLEAQGKPDEAITCYRKSLALKPDHVDAYVNLGATLRARGEVDEAIACYRKALALKPDFSKAHDNLGHILREQARLDEALECFRNALSSDPGFAEARWSLTMSQIPIVYEVDSDPGRFRSRFSLELDELDRWFDTSRVAEGHKAVGVLQPFWLAYQEENNRELLRRYGRLCARLMADWFDRQGLVPAGRRHSDGVIRIGIVSGHFRDHSVWHAIVKGWFQQLDRGRFALQAFHLEDREDQETRFARSRASHFEQGERTLRQWIETIAGQQPDVLLYPEIGMDSMTVRLASLRLASVQVATWGHPETTGLPTIDYYLSAEDLEPADAQENYTEQLVTLPHLGCFYEPHEIVAAQPELANLGIDPESPLLLCPGVPPKYAPQFDWVFTEIARRLGRCRFIFFTCHARNQSEKLRRRLGVVFARSRLDIDDYVTFIPWQSGPGFWGLLKRADVFLDTIGFSGFNTAMQAVECGLPIVTREGRFLRGRLASGILKRMGLQELVAQTEEDYIALVVRLVRDTEYREHIHARIEASRDILFEDRAPIRALEDFLVRATTRP